MNKYERVGKAWHLRRVHRSGLDDLIEARQIAGHLVALFGGVATAAHAAHVSYPRFAALIGGRTSRVTYVMLTKLREASEPSQGWVPRDLTIWRLRSLVALGYSRRVLSLRINVDVASLLAGRCRRGDLCHVSVAYAVRAAYREIGDAWAPKSASSVRACADAWSLGWPTPAGWDDPGTLSWPPNWNEVRPVIRRAEPAKKAPEPDPIAVQRAVSGEHVPLTVRERGAAITELHGRGWSDSRIAAQIGTTGETVLRTRRRLGLAANEENNGRRAS